MKYFLISVWVLLSIGQVWACESPSALSVTNIQPNQARISWQSIAGVSGYEISWRRMGTNAWQTQTTTAAVGNIITNLIPNTKYDVRVRSKCSDGFAKTYSTVRSFTTPCGAPIKPTVVDVGITEATVKWTAIPGVSAYRIAWRIVSENDNWKEATVQGNSRVLTALCQGSMYEVKVSARCTDGFSPYSEPRAFKTFLARTGADTEIATSLYPNPSQGNFELSFDLSQNATCTIQVLDVSGRVLKTETIEGYVGVNIHALDLSTLSTGIYHIKLRTPKGIQILKAVRS